MAKAKTEQLELIHGLMANYFENRLKAGGEIPAGELNAMLSFLKSNHISANITEDKPVQNLLEAFKDMDYILEDNQLMQIGMKKVK